jgi:hypothetical protein
MNAGHFLVETLDATDRPTAAQPAGLPHRISMFSHAISNTMYQYVFLSKKKIFAELQSYRRITLPYFRTEKSQVIYSHLDLFTVQWKEPFAKG